MPSPEAAIRTIIVDDEQLARTVVREHLAHHPEVEILAECPNGFDAVKVIGETRPDLVFLDIQMPKLDGFEVLELIDHVPAIIFVTAYDRYALKAFEVHAVDYLLKPFNRERFEEALTMAKQRIGKPDPASLSDIVTEARAAHKPLERVLIKEGSSIKVLPIDAIDYVEAQDDYVAFKSGGKLHLKQQRMAELESLLDASRFVRIHRSYILNIDRLARLEPYAKESRMAVLKDGTQLPVSRSGYDKLKQYL